MYTEFNEVQNYNLRIIQNYLKYLILILTKILNIDKIKPYTLHH